MGDNKPLSKRFQKMLKQQYQRPLLSGEIEIDEMYIHTGNKGIKKTNHDAEYLKNVEEALIE